ncbi:MAG: hypothetical protein LBL01_04495 [Bifidobacteriaceae bacterium]|jgi:hypothetical protein|nr:hypothetical protein [Bifidobacteriaceae bacterium]
MGSVLLPDAVLRVGARRRVSHAAAAAVALAAGLVAAGCGGGDEGFDSEAYCEAIRAPGVTLDAKALIEGDAATVEAAKEVYTAIRAKAPPALRDEWGVLVDDMDGVLQAARGDRDVTDSNYDAYSEAFTVIEQDKHNRCET